MKLFGRTKKQDGPGAEEALGLLLFDDVNEALAAERVLVSAGYAATLVAPPHNLRAGCDLAVSMPRVEHVGAMRQLAGAGVALRSWLDDAEGTMAVSDVVTSVDFGRWLMVRAGNMKVVVEKATGLIVNTSGGGCPDIPYLNLRLVGLTLAEAPRPRDLGYTLCGLMLDRAFAEARALLGSGGDS